MNGPVGILTVAAVIPENQSQFLGLAWRKTGPSFWDWNRSQFLTKTGPSFWDEDRIYTEYI